MDQSQPTRTQQKRGSHTAPTTLSVALNLSICRVCGFQRLLGVSNAGEGVMKDIPVSWPHRSDQPGRTHSQGHGVAFCSQSMVPVISSAGYARHNVWTQAYGQFWLILVGELLELLHFVNVWSRHRAIRGWWRRIVVVVVVVMMMMM
jgi:hypothetical protein